MVLLIGEGTKLSNYILEGNKAYRAGVRLGLTTDTLDVTGEVLTESPVNVSREQVQAAVHELQGEFEWEVPLYSAVKVDGKRLHAYAREGAEVKKPVKVMKFWDVKLVEGASSDYIVDLDCSKGSYVRTWIHQLGQRLGCGAAMSSLIRTYSAPFNLERAMSFEALEAAWNSGERSLSCLVPMGQALPKVKKVKIKGADQGLLMNGQISHALRAQLITQYRPGQDDLIQVHSADNDLLALIGLEPQRGFTLKRVFRPS